MSRADDIDLHYRRHREILAGQRQIVDRLDRRVLLLAERLKARMDEEEGT